MQDARAVRLVDVGDLPVWEFDDDQRLPTHDFFPLYHRRWLNSAFRLTGDRDSRALFFDLMCICRDQTPVGTLPDDDVQLAALLLVDLRTWQMLRARQPGPLHGWVRCRVGAEVRLMHPVVNETIAQALQQREAHRARSEAAKRKKARDRLPAMMQAAGVSARLCGSVDFVARLDDWLLRAVPPGENRSAEWIRSGVERLAG